MVSQPGLSPLTLPPDVPVSFVDGLHLRDTPLHVDVLRRDAFCFFTHAGAVPPTARLMTTRVAMTREAGLLAGLGDEAQTEGQVLFCSYRRPFTVGELTLTAYPSGHSLGSAQLLVARGGHKVLFTGPVNTRGTTLTPPADFVPCDTLVLDGTHGAPDYRIPERSLLLKELRDVAAEALRQGRVPLIFADARTTAAEAAMALDQAGVAAHGDHRTLKFCARLAELGVAMPEMRPAKQIADEPAALIAAAETVASKDGPPGRKVYRILLAGQAVFAAATRKFNVDHAIPLAASGDFADLLQLVERSGARRVLTVHGEAEKLASELRHRGLEAHALTQVEQLDLFGRPRRGKARAAVAARAKRA